METWLSYRLSDLLLFSEKTYLRQFELYHQWLGDWFMIGWCLWIFIPFSFSNQRLNSWLMLAAATAWWVAAYGFIWSLYRHINSVAIWLLILYLLQSAVLIFLALRIHRQAIQFRWSVESWLLWLYSGVGIIAIEWVSGLNSNEISRFLLTPDSLAMASLMLVSVSGQSWYYMIPALMLLFISLLTWVGLDSRSWWIPLIALVIVSVQISRHQRILYRFEKHQE